jgi:hypothetical protein
MMRDDAVRARRRIVCDELSLCPADDGAWAVVDALGDLWVPMPARPGFVARSVVPFSSDYVDALRSAMRFAPASSSIWVMMPAGVYESLGGFAGCSLRGGDGDE